MLGVTCAAYDLRNARNMPGLDLPEAVRAAAALPPRPFRFGINLWGADSRAAWQDKARKLEDLGFSMLTAPDHIGAFFSPMVALVSAAAVTSRIRLGTNVLNNDFYQPVLFARDAASVDILTDGRLMLGFGTGYVRSEYEQAGLRYDRGAVRLERLGESITILKHLFAGGPVTFSGKHFQVTEHELKPKPVQQPHPPLLIGGDGPRVLELAAREADIIGLTGLRSGTGVPPLDISGFRAAAVDDRVRRVQTAAGDRFAELELSALVQRVIVTDDRQQAAEQLAAELSSLSADDILNSPYLLIGTVDQMVEQLHAQRERWHISIYFAHEPAIDAIAPVVARLATFTGGTRG